MECRKLSYVFLGGVSCCDSARFFIEPFCLYPKIVIRWAEQVVCYLYCPKCPGNAMYTG